MLEPGCRMLLTVRGWGRFLGTDGSRLPALREVSFTLGSGEVLDVEGESGCGKSTLALTLRCLIEPDAGEVLFEGQNVLKLEKRAMKAVRRQMQSVFQDPFGSLNPRHTVAEIIREPLQIHRIGHRQEQHRRVLELLDTVGLTSEALLRHAHEFSGGQRQRIAIAVLWRSPRRS